MLNEDTPELSDPNVPCTVVIQTVFDEEKGFVHTERMTCFRPPDDPTLRAILSEAAMIPTEVIHPVSSRTLERLAIKLAQFPKTDSVQRRIDGIRNIIENFFPSLPASEGSDNGEEHF